MYIHYHYYFITSASYNVKDHKSTEGDLEVTCYNDKLSTKEVDGVRDSVLRSTEGIHRFSKRLFSMAVTVEAAL